MTVCPMSVGTEYLQSTVIQVFENVLIVSRSFIILGS
jgi:hypothetical protein